MRAHIATLLICLNYLLPATRNHSLVWRHAALWRAIRYRLGGLLANRTGLPFVTPWNSRNSTIFLLDQRARECRRNFSLLIHLTGRHRTKHCWPVETKCLAGSKLKSSLLHSSGPQSSHRTTHQDVCDLAKNIARNEIQANTINDLIQAKRFYPRITISATMYHENVKKRSPKFGTAVTTA